MNAICPSCGHCPTCGRSNSWYSNSPWNTGSPVWPTITTWPGWPGTIAMNDGAVADNTNAISQADLDTKTECKC